VFPTGLPDGNYILIPKIPIWVFFGGHWNGKCWCILWPFGIFHEHLVILLSFGIIFPDLVNCMKKDLATLVSDPCLTFPCTGEIEKRSPNRKKCIGTLVGKHLLKEIFLKKINM
jgi:hypothetical protein